MGCGAGSHALSSTHFHICVRDKVLDVAHCQVDAKAKQFQLEHQEPAVRGCRLPLQPGPPLTPLIDPQAANFALASRFRLTPCSAAMSARLR